MINIRTHAGTWVLNKHNVTKQIWLSSPISGPSKYNYHIPSTASTEDITSNNYTLLRGGQWLSERDDISSLQELLEQEFSVAFKQNVKFDFNF